MIGLAMRCTENDEEPGIPGRNRRNPQSYASTKTLQLLVDNIDLPGLPFGELSAVQQTAAEIVEHRLRHDAEHLCSAPDRIAPIRPAEPDGPLDQVALQPGALLVLAYLLDRGLTHVDVGELGAMYRRWRLKAVPKTPSPGSASRSEHRS